jgi:hypothetical protein
VAKSSEKGLKVVVEAKAMSVMKGKTGGNKVEGVVVVCAGDLSAHGSDGKVGCRARPSQTRRQSSVKPLFPCRDFLLLENTWHFLVQLISSFPLYSRNRILSCILKFQKDYQVLLK